MDIKSPQPLSSLTVADFLDTLASAEPAPGGGSAAALSGALAASLLAMVCRLTIGRNAYSTFDAEMRQSLAQAEPIGKELRLLIESDKAAYARVLDAYRLPKTTAADMEKRRQTIQEALKLASEVPLQVAEHCATLLSLALPVAAHGNRHAASDGGVGALLAEAGLRGAALNVLINLGAITDSAFVAACRSRVTELIALGAQRKQAVLDIVEGQL